MSKSRSISKLSYEEGTFTAYLATSASGLQALTGGIGNGALYSNNGRYIKMGNLVQISCYYRSASNLYWLNGNASSLMWIGGLPFVSKDESIFPAVTFGYHSAFLQWGAAYLPCGIIENGYNTIRVGYGDTNTFRQVIGAYLTGASMDVCFSATYKTGS